MQQRSRKVRQILTVAVVPYFFVVIIVSWSLSHTLFTRKWINNSGTKLTIPGWTVGRRLNNCKNGVCQIDLLWCGLLIYGCFLVILMMPVFGRRILLHVVHCSFSEQVSFLQLVPCRRTRLGLSVTRTACIAYLPLTEVTESTWLGIFLREKNYGQSLKLGLSPVCSWMSK